MGISRHLQDVSKGFETVVSFPELQHLPVILGESDPEGCAACSAQDHPENAYRNGAAYASYVAAVENRIFQLADRYKVNLAGVVTWAFEFENQPYFAGFRSLATNGVDKPVLNAFRMMGLMRGELLRSESSGGLNLGSIVQAGARGNPDISAMATRQNREVDILVWNYHDDDVSAPAAEIELVVNGIPSDAQRVLMQHYRVDGDWSNSYSVWKQMGSPQSPSTAQYVRLEGAGHLQLLNSPQWLMTHENGVFKLDFTLPRYGVSCIQLVW
jgi:xylan 1,4-beta-xylosidase